VGSLIVAFVEVNALKNPSKDAVIAKLATIAYIPASTTREPVVVSLFSGRSSSTLSESIRIPDISNMTRIVRAIPYQPAKDIADIADGVRYLVAYIASLDKNDQIGILAKDFEYINNYGIGNRSDTSCLKANPNDPCQKDYESEYTITEFEPIPKNSLIAELFVHENFTGPSMIVRNNTDALESIFHDSISNIIVYNGSNFRQGNYVQVCDRPFFTGNCLYFQPCAYNVESLHNFNDVIDSIRFVNLGR
jgi:hypothetical protein